MMTNLCKLLLLRSRKKMSKRVTNKPLMEKVPESHRPFLYAKCSTRKENTGSLRPKDAQNVVSQFLGMPHTRQTLTYSTNNKNNRPECSNFCQTSQSASPGL